MDFLRELLFLPRGASSVATEVDLLHLFVISVTMLGSTVVFVSALWFMWRYHESRRGKTTERIRAPLWYEALVIGGLLSLFLLWWVIGYGQYQTMQVAPASAIDVHVIAKQWMWQFADESGRRSQAVIVVPRGRPVRLVLTSRDVIHSVFVPAFRLKQDAVPGMYTYLWFEARETGTFDLYCTEYCGLEHSRMRAVVVVLEPSMYERWLEGEVPEEVASASGRVPASPEEEDLASIGRDVAVRAGCLSCHTVTGEPHIGPSWRGLYGRTEQLEDGTRIVADDAYLTQSMMRPELHVVRGYEPVMPSYFGILEHSEAAALVEYIRSLREPATEPPPVDLPPVAPLREGSP